MTIPKPSRGRTKRKTPSKRTIRTGATRNLIGWLPFDQSSAAPVAPGTRFSTLASFIFNMSSSTEIRKRGSPTTSSEAVHGKASLSSASNGQVTTSERMNALFHTFLWIAAGVFILYHTEMHDVLLHDPRVHQGFLNASVLLFLVEVALFSYCTFYVKFVLKINTDNLMEVCPRVIYTATFSGVALYTWHALKLNIQAILFSLMISGG